MKHQKFILQRCDLAAKNDVGKAAKYAPRERIFFLLPNFPPTCMLVLHGEDFPSDFPSEKPHRTNTAYPMEHAPRERIFFLLPNFPPTCICFRALCESKNARGFSLGKSSPWSMLHWISRVRSVRLFPRIFTRKITRKILSVEH